MPAPQGPSVTRAPSPTSLVFVPYWYVVVSPSLAGNASGQTSLTLDQDADFEIHYITGSCSLQASTDYRPNLFSVQISDKSNSRIWSSARTPQSHLGANENGFRLIRPVTLARRSNLNFDFLNLSGSTNVATITLFGAKIVNVR